MQSMSTSPREMAGDSIFSPVEDSPSPNSAIELNLLEGSERSEELRDDEGEEDFQIESDDLENEDTDTHMVKSNELQSALQKVLGFENFDLKPDVDQDVLEFDGQGEESDEEGEHIIEISVNDIDIDNNQMDRIPGDDDVDDDDGNAGEADTAVTGSRTNRAEEKSYLSPVVGMEFESYDDAYSYYNCYARELGFGIRVKSSWTKRNSKEKRGAVLCCNCEGFKTMKEASNPRKETRTGCLAMVRLRLVEFDRWRLDEVKLEHNHLFDHQRAQTSRSHKKTEVSTKRKLESPADIEVQTIKLYRRPAVDAVSYGSSSERELDCHIDLLKRLQFRSGDVVALNDYFHRAQLADPNFFYIMDLNDEGYARNVFWIGSRSRSAYGYFGDVIEVDSRRISNKHDLLLMSFSGLNHHGQSVLLGSGLIVDETTETYLWVMRAWLTCMSGRPPQTIITDQGKALSSAIAEVFPRAHHRLCLPLVMQRIREKLGEVGESEVFQRILNRAVYNSMKVDEFEMAWEEMVQHFSLREHEWLQSMYEDRERWIPVYMKDTLFCGIFTLFLPDECIHTRFHGYLHDQMTFDEFFNMHESLQQEMIEKEALASFEQRSFIPALRTSCNYEFQVSELYTKEIFLKFQEEVVLMSSSCLTVTQVHANGSIVTCMVKETDDEGDTRDSNNFEVVYDKIGSQVNCTCSCFNFRGYLCRHALLVLSYNGVKKVPDQYILTRWRKNVKRVYSPGFGSHSIDLSNPIQWHDDLYRRAMQVVAEGIASQEHHMVALQSLKEALSKVRLVSERPPVM